MLPRDDPAVLRVLIVDDHAVVPSNMAGAPGFLTKNVSHAKLIEAIRAAGRGESLLDTGVTRGVIQRLTELSEASPGPDSLLSDREREILALVAPWYTNKEIGATLFVSPYT